MNHIYKNIWNKATGTFVAVSELVNNSGGGQAAVTSGAAASFTVFCFNALSAALLFAWGSVAYAAPIGGTVTAGSANISSGGNTTTINQTSQNTTINWQSFGINKGETVNFVQPNSNAVALNRVLGNSASAIYGTLNANGKVFLINPNGILFGQGASVNVGGLVASTLNLSDADFMAGNYHFTGTSSASVQNQGAITAANGGYVALLGANVSNQGTITAKMGTVVLAGGQGITLDVAGDGLLNVVVNQGAVNALVQNGGLIQADGGQVLMTAQAAGQLLNTVVNNTGIIEVRTLDGKTGSIKLLGDMSSGTVNVGGTLDASASNGGNGGKIETSAAHVKVANDAVVTTKATSGLNGSWLIDPTDFTIAASGGDLTGAALSTSLAGANVTILTGTGGTGASGTNGDIFVNDAVSWSANNTLTLNAYRNININRSITSTGATGGVALLYGQGAVNAGNTATYNVNAPVNLAAGNNFNTKLGSDGATVNYTVVDLLGSQGSTTGTDLQGINGNLSGNYVLGANIDASATSVWNSSAGFTPISNGSSNFSGTLDGLGHTISNLTINLPSTNDVGLFGATGLTGTIRNVGLVGGSVIGHYYVGGLVGWNYGTISNSYATGAVSGSTYVGGLVGYNNGGTVSNSYATGTVSGSGGGGLVGLNNGTISNSYATGMVSGTGEVGGLVGYNNIGTISNSYATGAVSGTGSYFGGLVGYNYGTISNSYATGAVSGGSSGGLVGWNNGTISNSYWDTTTSGQATSAGGVGLTTTAMQTALNFVGFVFTTTPGATGNNWVMVDTNGTLNNAGGVAGATFPMLASEYSTTINNAHQLQLMAMNLAGSYTLGSNINASNTNTATALKDVWSNAGGFVPIGSTTTLFTGAFDGLGHTISNLTINLPSTNYVGLFGDTSATSAIRNVGLVGGSVTGGSFVGELVGSNNGTVSTSYATGAVSGSSYVGGLVGTNYGTVSNTYATGSVNASSNSAGGLVGFNGNGHSISNSYAAGVVTAGMWGGGLVGYNDPSGAISNSFWDSTITTGGIGNVASVSGATGLPTAQMKQQANFGGWDFATPVWGFGAKTVNNNRPILCVLGGCTAYVTVNSGSSVYGNGGSPLAFTNSLVNGAGNAITITPILAGTASYSAGAPTAASHAGSYSFSYLSGLSLTGSGVSSYTLASYATTASWTVNPLALTGASIAGVTTAYGTVAAPGTVSFGNVVGSDVVTDTASINSIAANNSASGHLNAGSYTQTAGTTLSGASAANYTFAGVTSSANYSVNPLAITVAANNASKTYGAANPALTVSYSGFASGETTSSLTTAATAATTATVSSSVGSYAITASGAVNPNYSFTYVNGLLTVNAVSQALPLASVYSPTTTLPVDGSTMAGNDIASEMPLSVGTDVSIKLFTDQPGAFDGLNLQIINHGIKLPKGWIIGQASDNTL